MTLQVLPRYQDRRVHIACGHLVHRLQRENSGGFTVDQDVRLDPAHYEGHYRETDIIEFEVEDSGGRGGMRRHIRWLRVNYACDHCGGLVLWESLTRPATGNLPPGAYYETDEHPPRLAPVIAQVAEQLAM